MADLYLCTVTIKLPNKIVADVLNNLNVSDSQDEAAKKAEAVAIQQNPPEAQILSIDVVTLKHDLVREAAERVLGWQPPA